MAKTTAPLFGFGASGKLGDALVFGRWKGIDVARRYVIPANPQTSPQSTQRGYMTEAVDEWHATGVAALTGADKSAWNRYAGVLTKMSGFNAFCKEWIAERVAGGTPPGHFINGDAGDPSAASFDCTVEGVGLTTENCTLHYGVTKTFFPGSDVQAAVAGVVDFANINTGFAAGQILYWWVEVGTPGTAYMRTGLYATTLT